MSSDVVSSDKEEAGRTRTPLANLQRDKEPGAWARRILIIDPDVDFTDIVRSNFALIGCKVEVARDGNTGVELAKARPPGLILLTIEQPEGMTNGFLIYEKLRVAEIEHVPIVVLSGEMDQEKFNQHNELRSPAQGYIRKPIDFPDLFDRIGHLVPKQTGITFHIFRDNQLVSSKTLDQDFIEVGKHASSDLEIGDGSSATGNRAIIERLSTGETFIIDLGAGVMVNGQRVGRTRIHTGDELRIGSTVIVPLLHMDAAEEVVLSADEVSACRIHDDEARSTDDATRTKPPVEEAAKSTERPTVNPSHKRRDISALKARLGRTIEPVQTATLSGISSDPQRDGLPDRGGDPTQAALPSTARPRSIKNLKERLGRSLVPSQIPVPPESVARPNDPWVSGEDTAALHRITPELARLAHELLDKHDVQEPIAPSGEAETSGTASVATNTSAEDVLSIHVRWTPDGRLATRHERAWTTPRPLNVTDAVLQRVLSGRALREDADHIGHELFSTLMAEAEVAAEYAYKLERATVERPLRVCLQIETDSETSQGYSAGDLFWETAHDRKRYRHLGAALDVRLIRSVVGAPTTWRKQQRRPRLAVAFSSPRVRIDGSPFNTLALINEIQGFNDLTRILHASSRLDARIVHRLGIDNVCDELAAADLFHFSGHGEAGTLLLQSADNREQLLDGDVLQQALASPPQLVSLNCCRGGVNRHQQSLPIKFLRRGVSCVIAMQGDLQDDAALVFAREFYVRIAAGDDVETALQKTRWRLFSEQRHEAWFLPALWSACAVPFALELHDQRRQDSVVQAARALDAQAHSQLPTATILERIHTIPGLAKLSDAGREALVRELAAELLEDSNDLGTQATQLLQDRTRIKHLVRNLPDDNSPKDALKRTLNAIEHTLIPQLDRVLQVLPLSAERGGATLVSERVSILANEARGEPVSDDPLELPTADLDPFVSKIVDDVSLPEKMVQRCLVHLLAGRHLILVGPPGTGKSTIAGKLCRALGYDAELATANPDWTTQDVVGGLAPHAHTDATGEVRVGYGVRDGCVAAAIKRNWATEAGRWERTSSEAGKGVWLIIDEINRAPMDHAFGDLFSALVSGVLHVPRVSQAGDIGTTLAIPIPQDFRLIGTANTADRHLLFQMSEALKRRFAFVEVPAYFSSDRQVPVDHIPRIVRQLSERPQLRALRIPDLSERLTLLLSLVNPVLGRIRALHDLGIAQILDALCTTLVESRFRPEVPLELVLSDVLGDQAMQALDSLPADALRLVAALLNGSAHCFLAELLHRWLALGDEIPTPARAHMFALRGYFSTHSDPLWQSFAAALDDALYRRASWSTVAAALPNAPGLLAALDVAAPLAERLIRLADARE